MHHHDISSPQRFIAERVQTHFGAWRVFERRFSIQRSETMNKTLRPGLDILRTLSTNDSNIVKLGTSVIVQFEARMS